MERDENETFELLFGKPTTRARKLATEHWDWLGPLLQKIYTDAFEHGYKHGEEASDDERKARCSK